MREAGVDTRVIRHLLVDKDGTRAFGVFDFEWLDRLMDLLHAHGVSVNLATPTASPPAWMVRQHPEMLPVTARGSHTLAWLAPPLLPA